VSHECRSCGSQRMVTFKTYQMQYEYNEFYWRENGKRVNGNHFNHGFGGSDDFQMSFCADCGKLAGKFPMELSKNDE
jgi:hypothetical protein